MDIAAVFESVHLEILRAQKKFNPFNSLHEAHSVLLEEVEEFWDDVKFNNLDGALTEAIQVAAMAIRIILDLHPEVNANPFDRKET